MVEKKNKRYLGSISLSSAMLEAIKIVSEQKSKENLTLLLKNIRKAVEVYNSFEQEEKIEIVSRKKNENKEVDVSNIFVCVYNDEHVGLFRKINYNEKTDRAYYNAGSIYVGVDSDYIGMKETHCNSHCTTVWKKAGAKVKVDDHVYLCNCNMENGMSFDDMRLKMFEEGLIDSYKIGKSSSEEMIEVLCYARSHYHLDTKGTAKGKK